MSGLPLLNGDAIGTLASLAPAFPGEALAALSNGTSNRGEVWRFDGASWTLVTTLAPKQVQPRPLVFLEGQLFMGNQQALWSGNLGRTWRQISDPDEHHDDHRAIYADRALNRVWDTTDGEGNGSEGNEGNLIRWRWPRNGRAPEDPVVLTPPRGTIQAYYVGVIPQQAGGVRRLHVGTHDNSAFCANDSAAPAWSSFGSAGGGDVFAFAVHPTSPNVAYALDNGRRIWHTSRAGEPFLFGLGCAPYWDSGAPFDGVSSAWSRNLLAVDPAVPSTVYVAGTARKLFRSQDYGETIEELDGPPVDVQTNALLVEGAYLFAATDEGVWRGHYEPDETSPSWEPWGLNGPNDPDVLVLTSGRGAAGVQLWAGTSRGLWRLRGPAWEVALPARSDTVEDVVSDVLVDPTCPSRVYAARGFRVRRHQNGGGILRSDDTGDHWEPLTDDISLGRVPITDLDIDPSQPTVLYVATFGLGIWRLDWDQLPACGGPQ